MRSHDKNDRKVAGVEEEEEEEEDGQYPYYRLITDKEDAVLAEEGSPAWTKSQPDPAPSSPHINMNGPIRPKPIGSPPRQSPPSYPVFMFGDKIIKALPLSYNKNPASPASTSPKSPLAESSLSKQEQKEQAPEGDKQGEECKSPLEMQGYIRPKY